MPHMRMIFKDEEALRITIKLLCLYIRQQPSHHPNERPRLIESLRQVVELFMGIVEFRSLDKKCSFDRVKSLTPQHIDLIM
mmetsp:Transcript_28671/g.43298  ORF Transcript_28671/g.43298 Transcript_28671/m.43298 type:complete len:81 (+) Transcript_28671:3093-3335(+)